MDIEDRDFWKEHKNCIGNEPTAKYCLSPQCKIVRNLKIPGQGPLQGDACVATSSKVSNNDNDNDKSSMLGWLWSSKPVQYQPPHIEYSKDGNTILQGFNNTRTVIKEADEILITHRNKNLNKVPAEKRAAMSSAAIMIDYLLPKLKKYVDPIERQKKNLNPKSDNIGDFKDMIAHTTSISDDIKIIKDLLKEIDVLENGQQEINIIEPLPEKSKIVGVNPGNELLISSVKQQPPPPPLPRPQPQPQPQLKVTLNELAGTTLRQIAQKPNNDIQQQQQQQQKNVLSFGQHNLRKISAAASASNSNLAAAGGPFGNKYRKYKNKYMKLKKLLNY